MGTSVGGQRECRAGGDTKPPRWAGGQHESGQPGPATRQPPTHASPTPTPSPPPCQHLLRYFKGANDEQQSMDLTTPTLVALSIEKEEGNAIETNNTWVFFLGGGLWLGTAVGGGRDGGGQ